MKLAETAETHIVSFEQIHWLTKLDAEHENLRATLKYSLSNGNDTKSGMKLAKTLTEYWNMRSYFDEQLYWQKTALDKSESHRETPLRAKLLYDYGLINNTIRRKGKESQPMFEESLRIFKGLGEEYLSDYAYVLLWLGYQKYWEGHDTGKSKMREAIQIFEELDEKRGHGWALNLMAMLLLNEGKHHSALEAAKKGAALYKDCGDRFGYAICVDDLGTISLIQGNYTDAIKYYEETKGIYKEFRDKGFACQTIHGLGEAYRGLDEYEIAETYYRESLIMREEAGMASSWFVAVYQSLAYSVLRQGKKQQATSYFKEALELSRELSYKSSIIHCLAGFAAVAILQGKGNESALLFGAVDAQFQSLIAEGMKPDSLIEPVDRKEFEHYQTLCRAQLGKDDFESAMEEGKTMNLEEAIAFVTEKFNE